MQEHWPAGPHIAEARCTTCGETFNPGSPNDLQHMERVDGTQCGGPGVLAGFWSSAGTPTPGGHVPATDDGPSGGEDNSTQDENSRDQQQPSEPPVNGADRPNPSVGKPDIRLLLDMSTAHLPEHLGCGGLDTVPGVVAHRTECGWLLWVPDDPNESAAAVCDTVPAVVLDIQRYARSHGCDYVLSTPTVSATCPPGTGSNSSPLP